MEKGRNNCDEINRASKKVTNITLLPYKTPILHGAIQINNEYNKNVNDGIDYKNLCLDLHKYVNAQKKCVQNVTALQKRPFVTKEWKDIIKGLAQTYNAKNIKKICYYEGDKETTKKKHVLNIHDVFRKFCIQKKIRLQNKSDMDFLKCNEYLSWIAEKKRELQSLDPDYKYIEEYEEYFHIHDNCNYPWLLKKTPDITCTMTTRTKAKEREGKGKSLSDTSKDLPVVNKDDSTSDNMSKPSLEKPPSKAIDHNSNLPPSSFPEQTPKKSTPHAGGNTIPQPNISDVILSGTSMPEPDPIFPPPIDNKHPQLKSFFEFLYNNLDGKKIQHDVDHSMKRKPVKISKDYPNYVQGDPILSTINKPYKYIPEGTLLSKKFFPLLLSKPQFAKTVPPSKQSLSPILPSQPISPSIPNSKNFSINLPHAVNYVPINKFTKFPVPFINELRPLPKITSGTINYCY
ncbi:hypothetical protein POVWA2_087330 [Plasmodium ovale wallikeri]|uniref:STP1 protein n=1 Tax=Plasmodium ovale wallikeri TaxID=864142 RepID=A0A1A9ARK2_PLAOA|nr:hypothetical protein POVWA2_087330 [Plasmodium ovale wallikeri]